MICRPKAQRGKIKMKKFKIASLGAATLDVYLQGEVLTASKDVRSHDFVTQFPLGEKLELDGMVFSTGGGANNAAVTFARQGMGAQLLAKIADDLAGAEIVRALKAERVNTDMVACDLKGATGYSTILLAPRGERTILVYRGVSEQLASKDFAWSRLRADWLYITSLAGNLKLLEKAVSAAHKAGIKVALDPGSRELAKPARIKKLLPKLELIKGNREEMAKLFPATYPEDMLKKAAKTCKYAVVTDGPRGSFATDGNNLYRAGMYKDVKVVDRTGAGDAFGSGLVAILAQGKDMPAALTFGSANSTSVVQHVGAKPGILRAGAKLKPMRITSKPL